MEVPRFKTEEEFRNSRRPTIDATYPGKFITSKKCWGITKWRWKEIYGIGYPKFLISLTIVGAILWYLPLSPLTILIMCAVGFWGGIGLGGALVHKWVYVNVDRPEPVLIKLPNQWRGWGGKN